MSDLPFVSVVMPVYNEKRYIAQAIQSLGMQDYPKDRMEAVLVDGMSTDGTVDCIRQAMVDYPFIRLIDNPETATAAEPAAKPATEETQTPAENAPAAESSEAVAAEEQTTTQTTEQE